ncbi:MAG: rRNA pseudouridine synthase [Ruminococcaceae bacterium]|nr:rRNA pseudouridine synthase [Oscillospiraceae bacterium]
MKVRLQKYLSDCGVMSRRKAEEEMKKGTITVNNKPCELGQKVDDSDIIMFNGKIIERTTDTKSYYILNKPRGYVTTMSDERGRKCIADLIKDIPERVYPVGRLDLNSEGLVILTNDGDVANRLMHPKGNVEKIYMCKVRGTVSTEQLTKLRSALVLDGYTIMPVEVTVEKTMEDGTVLKFPLKEGRNRQIRKMCEQCELEVMRLKRVSIGKITLGGLHSGAILELSKQQIDYLKSI